MGSFSKIEKKIERIKTELDDLRRMVGRLRVVFKNTPEEELEVIKSKVEELEKNLFRNI